MFQQSANNIIKHRNNTVENLKGKYRKALVITTFILCHFYIEIISFIHFGNIYAILKYFCMFYLLVNCSKET